MTFDAVFACALLLLKGQVLHIVGAGKTVTAASGSLLVRLGGDRPALALRNVDAYTLAAKVVDELGPAVVLKSMRIRASLPSKGRVEWIV